MRDIHPSYPEVTITCACGNTVKTRSTRGDFTVDVCGNCHPFYTGKQKLMDTAGRVDRFRKKFGDAKPARAAAPPQQVAQPKPEGAKEKKKKDKKAGGEKPAEAAPAEEKN